MSNAPPTDLLSATIEQVADQEFDYVIIGGGTSGLTLAARLTEDPNVTVAVLEAGGENINVPAIRAPATFGRELGNPERASFHNTPPQSFSNNRSYAWNRGKGLGGSSMMNFMVWCKPSTFDIDAWERLGTKGWNWDSFKKYTMKAEGFIPPPPEQVENYHYTYELEHRGTTGPLTTGFPSIQCGGELIFQKAVTNLGVPILKDHTSGKLFGTTMHSHTIDTRTGERVYATNAYFVPNAKRPNLKVLTYAQATKIVSKDGDSDLLEATGVEFIYGGASKIVHAKREVIVSVGTIKSPAILELSGIGDKKILEPLGIPTKVHNPNVGENMQEHILLGTVFELNSEKYKLETVDSFADPEVEAYHMKLFEKNEGLYRVGITTFTWLPMSTVSDRSAALIAKEEEKIAELQKEGYFETRPGLLEQYQIQLEALKRDDLPDHEIIYGPFFFPSPLGAPEKGHQYGSIVPAMNHPFSRGSVHIKSADPLEDPLIDPRVFEHDIDLQNLVESIKYGRRIMSTEPAKDLVVKEIIPGPKYQTDEEIADFVRETAGTMWHTTSTLCMLPRDKGGVVDEKLKVYGTKNIRVVDLSIIPLQIMAHTQSSCYGIAEQAADIIKSEW